MKTHPDGSELMEWIGKPDPVVLDIGCNDGEHTAQFLRLFPRARIYAFEPDVRAIDRFHRVVSNERVQLFDIALSDRDGEIEFYPSSGFPSEDWQRSIPSGWDRSGSIRKPKQHLNIWPWCKFGEGVKVRTRRLDTWANEHRIEQVDLMWADVQGAEVDLINGGMETLKRTRYFFTEYSEMELYEGQSGLQGIFELLPNFVISKLYRGWNAMFRNETQTFKTL